MSGTASGACCAVASPPETAGPLLNAPHAHASEWAKVMKKQHLLE
ncbi:MAG: hypothetical protein Q8K18_07165 [Burkholderiales bacterium]|nr:hypothetical protein [Burkholderiales bacterium]